MLPYRTRYEVSVIPTERIERRISLHDLRVLVAVVETGSMGRAARRLATSQPAVSRAISDLEHALGVRLLDRGRQGVEPTAYGRALVARGLAIFDELTQGIGDIGFLADPTAGQLRIGASIAVAVGLVAAVIDRLSAQHPRLAFDLLSTDTTSAFQSLARREVDLLVVHLVAPLADETMQTEVLFDDPHVVVAAAGSPWARRRRVGLADLMDAPWMLPRPDAPYGSVVAEAFRTSGLPMPRTVVLSTLPVRSVLLTTGRYLSMIPRVALQFPLPGPALKVLPIELPSTPRPLAIVTLKNRTLSPVAHTFIDGARRIAGAVAAKR
jgi:DNA-binding transcriptional LysR family regulator